MGNEYGSETLEPCYFAEFIFSDSAILNINCCSSSLVPSFFSCHSFMVPSFLRVIATFFFSFHCFYKGSPPFLILLSSSSFFDFSHSILHSFLLQYFIFHSFTVSRISFSPLFPDVFRLIRQLLVGKPAKKILMIGQIFV